MATVVVRRTEVLEPVEVPTVLVTGIARIHYSEHTTMVVFSGPNGEDDIAAVKLVWPNACWQAEMERLRTGKCAASGEPTH